MGKVIGFLTIMGLFIAAVVGWVLNIIALVGMTGFSGLLVARVIGIFIAPLGAVLGLFV